MIRAAIIVVLLVLVASAGAVRASTVSTREALERAVAALEQAERLAEPQRRAELASISSRLKSERALGGAAWLVEPIERSQPDLALARTRLIQALDALGPPAESDLQSRRQALQDVIHGPPFVTRDLKSTAPEWLVPLVLLLEWLGRTLGDAIRWPFDRLGELIRAFLDGPLFPPIVSIVALAAIASLVLLYRRGLRAALVSEAALASPLATLPPTSSEAIERAQRLAADGRYRDACHFMFLSSLLWIEEHGQTRFERSETNWEHLQRLDRRSPITGPFRRLVDRFDRIWYGQADVSSSDFRDLESLTLDVRKAAA